MSEEAKKAAEQLSAHLGDSALGTNEFRDEYTVTVALDSLHGALAHCKEELGFDYLVDICSVDNMGDDPRFEMVYELYSYASGAHLRVKSPVPEDEPVAPTVSDIWPTANWHEREVWDMMGIKFSDHPDLRRILMWEGYPFFPLRKEFPLAGKPSEMPDVAFTGTAPLEGGQFVTSPTTAGTAAREPRANPTG